MSGNSTSLSVGNRPVTSPKKNPTPNHQSSPTSKSTPSHRSSSSHKTTVSHSGSSKGGGSAGKANLAKSNLSTSKKSSSGSSATSSSIKFTASTPLKLSNNNSVSNESSVSMGSSVQGSNSLPSTVSTLGGNNTNSNFKNSKNNQSQSKSSTTPNDLVQFANAQMTTVEPTPIFPAQSPMANGQTGGSGDSIFTNPVGKLQSMGILNGLNAWLGAKFSGADEQTANRIASFGQQSPNNVQNVPVSPATSLPTKVGKTSSIKSLPYVNATEYGDLQKKYKTLPNYFDGVDTASGDKQLGQQAYFGPKGILIDKKTGQPVDTSSFGQTYSQTRGDLPEPGYAIFGMDENGGIDYGDPSKDDMTHPNLNKNAHYTGAGEFHAFNGNVDVLTDKSGHYQAFGTPEHFAQILKEMKSHGKDVSKVTVKSLLYGTMNGRKYLDKYGNEPADF